MTKRREFKSLTGGKADKAKPTATPPNAGGPIQLTELDCLRIRVAEQELTSLRNGTHPLLRQLHQQAIQARADALTKSGLDPALDWAMNSETFQIIPVGAMSQPAVPDTPPTPTT